MRHFYSSLLALAFEDFNFFLIAFLWSEIRQNCEIGDDRWRRKAGTLFSHINPSMHLLFIDGLKFANCCSWWQALRKRVHNYSLILLNEKSSILQKMLEKHDQIWCNILYYYEEKSKQWTSKAQRTNEMVQLTSELWSIEFSRALLDATQNESLL